MIVDRDAECMLTSASFSFIVLQEDELIVELVGKYGSKKWSVISQSLPGRIGKQCRERYIKFVKLC